MLSLDENQIYLYTSSLSGILDIRSNQTFILLFIIIMDETTKKLLSTTDAKVWADEFCKMYPQMEWDVML
jgi:hypothetical protein